MFGKFKKDKVSKRHEVPTLEKDGLAPTLANDIIGTDDWRRSKVGYLTGFSAAKRAVGSIGGAAKGAVGRTSSLASGLFSDDRAPELSEVDKYDDMEKFAASARLHGLNGDGMRRTIKNTYRAGRFYAFLTMINLLISLYFLLTVEALSFKSVLFIGPMPLLAALAFRNFYLNWMVRERRLSPIRAYLKSGSIWPHQ